MKNSKLFALGLVSLSAFLFDACREFPPSDNQEDNDITINNNITNENINDVNVGLPADNSSIQLSNNSDSNSDSSSTSDSNSDSDSNSSSDNSSSSSSRRNAYGFTVSNVNDIEVYSFKMIE